MKRRLLSILAAVALVFGVGTAVAAYHALPARAATVGATGPITGYEGLCLDDRSASTADGTTVDLYTCNGTGAQTWVPQSDGALLNPNSGKCLDDTGYGGSGTQVQIWSCADTSNQQWKLP